MSESSLSSIFPLLINAKLSYPQHRWKQPWVIENINIIPSELISMVCRYPKSLRVLLKVYTMFMTHKGGNIPVNGEIFYNRVAEISLHPTVN